MMGKQIKSAPFKASMRADSLTVVSMQMRQPTLPISVSNTGKESPGSTPEMLSLTARWTLRYTPATLPSGETSTALFRTASPSRSLTPRTR